MKRFFQRIRCTPSTTCLPLLLALLGQSASAAEATDERVDRARQFVAQMAAGEFGKAVATFDETMAKALPASTLKQVWDGLVRQHGPFRKTIRTRSEKLRQYAIIFVTCQFERAALDAKVVFNSSNQISGLFFLPLAAYRRPAYVDPSSFQEHERTIGNGLLSLPGTLSLPKGKGPFPAIVLVHGSGPNDRDETIGPNKPFLDLAQGLASRGIAALRYEKRTKQHPVLAILSASRFTVKEETVDDALDAVTLLEKTDTIDRHRIFVLGHSLGGTLIPRIGKAGKTIAGFVILAGATRPVEDLILEQTRYLISLDPAAARQQQRQLEKLQQQVAAVKALDPTATPPATQFLLGAPATYWLDLRGYDPASQAKALPQPILVLQGERDYQVTMKDFANWKTALASRKDVAFRSYPALNHLFVEGAGKSTPEEYAQPGNVAAVVIEDVASWITTGSLPSASPWIPARR